MGEFEEDYQQKYSEWRVPDQAPPEILDTTIYKMKDLIDSNQVEATIWPTLQGLCEDMKISLDQLPATIKEAVRATAVEMRKFTHENYFSENILLICKCYHALQNEEDLPSEISELKDELSNFQNFSHTLLTDVDLTDLDGRYEIRRFSRWIDEVNTRTAPTQFILSGEEESRGRTTSVNSHVYIEPADLESEWVRYNAQAKGENIKSFVHKEFKDYAKQNSSPKSFSQFFHATTSAALRGIADHGGLLSRPVLQERGGFTRSGERADYFPAVYVTRHLTSGFQYTDTSWFNEYPIHIGIKEEAEGLIAPTPEHGETLGQEVPISFINALYVPFANIDNVKDWVAKNNLDIEVYPIEKL